VRAGDVEMVETVHRSSRPVLDLVVDAVRGYIYWTTASTVELATLDGNSHSVIFRSSLIYPFVRCCFKILNELRSLLAEVQGELFIPLYTRKSLNTLHVTCTVEHKVFSEQLKDKILQELAPVHDIYSVILD